MLGFCTSDAWVSCNIEATVTYMCDKRFNLNLFEFKMHRLLPRTNMLKKTIGLVNANFSVPNSSDGLIFVKRQALDGPFLDKNTGFRRAIFPKRPSRRARPSLAGPLGHTAYYQMATECTILHQKCNLEIS